MGRKRRLKLTRKRQKDQERMRSVSRGSFEDHGKTLPYKVYAVALGLLIAVSFVLYGNTIGHELLYDDSFYTRRVELRDPAYLPRLLFEPLLPEAPQLGTYRPVTVMSFALSYILFGESPVHFHLSSIILNGLVTFLVFAVSYRLFGNRMLAVLAAAVFAFMPIHSEVVSFAKAREEILAAALFLASWLTLLAGADKRRWYAWWGVSAVLFLASILSKEVMIVAFVPMVLSLAGSKHVSRRKVISVLVLYSIVGLCSLAMRYVALGQYAWGTDALDFTSNPLKGAPYGIRFWTACKMLFLAAGKTLVPVGMSVTYTYNRLPYSSGPLDGYGVPLLGLILLFVCGALIFLRRTRTGPLGIGSAVFLSSYFLSSKFIFNAGDLFAERWLYVPSIGTAMIVGWVLYSFTHWSRAGVVLFVAAFALLYGAVIIPRNLIWKDRLSLYQSMVHDAPGSVVSHASLGKFLLLTYGDLDASEELARTSLAIYPQFGRGKLLLARVHLFGNNLEEAERILEDLFKTKGSNPESLAVLARLRTAQKRYEESNEILLTHNLLTQSSTRHEAREAASLNYYNLGDYEKAREYAQNVTAEDVY